MYLRLWILLGLVHTLFEIFIFVQKFNFDFPRKLPIFLGWKTRENVVVLDFLAVDNFDFTRKIVKNILGEKLVKMLGFCQNWISGLKFDFSNGVFEYLPVQDLDVRLQVSLVFPFGYPLTDLNLQYCWQLPDRQIVE